MKKAYNVKACAITAMVALNILLLPTAALADPPAPGEPQPPRSTERKARPTGKGSTGDGATTAAYRCSEMWWNAETRAVHYFGGLDYADHLSQSRNWYDHNAPCDIDTIGTRGRWWRDNVLHTDSGMQYAYNSADKNIRSGEVGEECGGGWDPVYAQGDHYLANYGYGTWTPVTSERG